MSAKKILIAAETPVLPIDRGNRKRIWNLMKLLEQHGCEVDFLYLDTYDDADITETREWIGEEHFYSIQNKKRSFPVFVKRKIRKIMEILHCQIAFKYFSLDERVSPKLDDDLKEFFDSHHYDQVWVVCIYNSRVFLSVPKGTLKVLETQNVSCVKRQEYEAVGYRNYEFALKKDVEAKGLARADVVIAIQNEEEAFFESILPDCVKAVTIGENMPVHEPHVSSSKMVLFLGSTYVINRDGLMNFIDNVLPVLKEKCPEAEVVIAGSICKTIPDSADYRKMGWVDDLDEIYKQARVVINPVRHGAGLNIKMVEALSQAKPIVSVQKGMRGLKGCGASVTDDPVKFAEEITAVIRDDRKALEMSERAVDFMKEYEEANSLALKELLDISV
ncbi:MAG: glycosyltransferase family 4 protein [Lachnospiraceae bacterium]|nr:glycosyltransferase family 4 protein [Lachnospiraceae bacterium]